MASLEAKQTYSGRRPVAGLPNAGRRQTIRTTRSRLAMDEMEKTIWASLRHWSFANLHKASQQFRSSM